MPRRCYVGVLLARLLLGALGTAAERTVVWRGGHAYHGQWLAAARAMRAQLLLLGVLRDCVA